VNLYSAYGLTLESELPLPDLVSGSGTVDVSIRVSDTSTNCLPAQGAGIRCLGASADNVRLIWDSVGELNVQNGSRITIRPCRDAEEDALRLFLVGAGFGTLLHQRGVLVLHGSGVVVNGQAIGILGGKGWGKSTTAMALHQRGHALISDELLAIQWPSGAPPQILPGSSRIKLWSDALSSVGGDPTSATPVRPGVTKYFVSGPEMAREEYPLRRLYLLGAGDQLALKPVSPSEAFFGVVPHLYVSRFGTEFLRSTGNARTFQQVHALLKTVSVARLLRQRDLVQLPKVASLIEADCL
jgi:hypothetical protein